MSSRKLQDLQPQFEAKARQFVALCDEQDFEVLIYCTRRTLSEQARLYRNGRNLSSIQRKAQRLKQRGREDLGRLLLQQPPQYGRSKLTWAGPGESYHNHGFAFDAVPMRQGKPVWGVHLDQDNMMWQQMGSNAKRLGLEWSGDWSLQKREYPHIQMPDVNLDQLFLEIER